jgi:hypothetical protein
LRPLDFRLDRLFPAFLVLFAAPELFFAVLLFLLRVRLADLMEAAINPSGLRSGSFR